jgi:hypothetical protein
VLALILVDLVLESIDVPTKYLFDCFLPLFDVLLGVMAFFLKLLALTGIPTKSAVC